MPSKSKAQHNLMAMVANDPAAAKRVGVPQSVGEEYMKADKGRKFGTGGAKARPDLQKVNKPSTRQGKTELFAKGGNVAESKAMMKKEVAFMKQKGAPKSMVKHEEAEMKEKKYAKGGSVKATPMGKVTAGGKRAHGEHTVQQKGHTKGKMVAMKRGGKC